MEDNEKICPRCAETIKKAALVCRFCSQEFEPPVSAPESPAAIADGNADSVSQMADQTDETAKLLRNIGLGGVGVLALIVMVVQCSGQPTGSTDNYDLAAENLEAAADEAMANLDAAIANTDTAVGATDTSSTGWDVSSSVDQLRGGTIHTASIISQNEVNFDFPYAGGSHLTMTVRRHPEWGDDVMFVISDGQFNCGIDDCSGMISVDGKVEQLSLVTPESHDSETLFAEFGEGIIERLQGSHEVIVELPFYQEGNRQFTFKTEGLQWPPKAPTR